MYYRVSEIKSWQDDFPRGILEIKTKINSDKAVLNDAIEARSKHAEEIKRIQGLINELISKYGKYIPYAQVNNDIEAYIAGYNPFIETLEKEIPALELELVNAENGEKIVKEGLKKRIERETTEIKPYNSLEANFINSLYQIKDAVLNLDKLYTSEEIFTVNKKIHKPSINQEKINELRNKISLLPTQAEKNNAIKAVVDRLKEKQKEENHQIKRLVAAQNNAMYDNQVLTDFLSAYSDGVFHTKSEIPKIKQEVMELTGVNIKDPYYDIVEDWQNGDYTLWMVGNGSGLRWWLDPETLRIDIDSVIEQLNGKNQYYFSLESILNEIKSKKTDLLAMDGQSFANKSLFVFLTLQHYLPNWSRHLAAIECFHRNQL
jgi:hypothetical protein